MFNKIKIEVIFLHFWIWSVTCIIVPEPALSPVMSSYATQNDSPEGYYAFIESAKAEPPAVKPPPYFKSKQICPGLLSGGRNQILHNLCGDLNKGVIPANPMRQNIYNSPYPFDLLKNKTLEFFSKTLPILKADETLPKVAKYHAEPDQFYYQQYHHPATNIKPPKPRLKRETSTNQDTTTESKATKKDTPKPATTSFSSGRDIITTILDQIEKTRTGRRFCETGGGIMCMLYRAFQGRPLGSGMLERRDDDIDYKKRDNMLMENGPPTPCPAKVEYATPVFARNYQGVWRYVVQIPYEGYFTQTLEVTKCLQTKCYYMDGGCLSSPRWASLLVAEIFYPDTFLPPIPSSKLGYRPPVNGEDPPSIQDFQNYQSYLQKRAGKPSPDGVDTNAVNSSKKSHCDGIDDLGCFQVRLYYDWFLVPGSCKCWRPDYFSRYIRRKAEL